MGPMRAFGAFLLPTSTSSSLTSARWGDAMMSTDDVALFDAYLVDPRIGGLHDLTPTRVDQFLLVTATAAPAEL